MPAGDSKGRNTGGASKKPVPLPKVSKGCWLDTLKVQAHAKRRAAILAVGASKRAALGQGPRPAAAAAGKEGEPLCTPPEGGWGEAAAEGGHNGYTVLYKFNEGYTNAVKRPIKMAELLGLQHAAQ
jgi:chromosome transmission fidelity protein 18